MNRAEVNDDKFWCMVELLSGKVRCPCGNADWRQFSYVPEMYPLPLLADCDKCGRLFSHEIGEWILCCGQPEGR
jgi:hypothetical protein